MTGAVALVYAFAMAQQALFVVVAYSVAIAAGAVVQDVAIGGPPLVRLRVRKVVVGFGPLPSGWVNTSGASRGEMSLGRRLAIRLVPWVILLLVAVACLGPGNALRSFGVGFQQIVLVVDPRPLVAAFFELANVAPVHVTFGLLLTKLVAVNLLPFSPLAGGAVLDECARRERPRWWLALSLVFVFVWIVGRFAWAVLAVVF